MGPYGTHTACLPVKSNIIQYFPDQNSINTIVNIHNYYRSLVSNPTASDMREVTWDVDLAMLAQNWAAQGNLAHDCFTCRTPLNNYTTCVGQNAFKAPKDYANNLTNLWMSTVDSWYSEIQYFDYNSSSGSSTGMNII